MATVYRQTDTASDCGVAVYCTARTAATTGVDREVDINGTAGTNEFTITISAEGSRERAIYFQPIEAPGLTEWAGGIWTVIINVTTANMKLTIEDLYICRLNSSCASQGTVAESNGLGLSVGGTGNVTAQATQVGTETADATDDWIAVLTLTSTDHGAAALGVTPDQTVAAPYNLGGAVVDTNQMWTSAGSMVAALSSLGAKLLHNLSMMVRGQCSGCNRRKAKLKKIKDEVERFLKAKTGRDIPASPMSKTS